jgi:hypothetical protein
MTNWQDRANELLLEFNLCCQTRPQHDTVSIQIEKDAVAKWANYLNTQRCWGSDNDIAEACYQLEPRLKKLKEKIIIEVISDNNIR